MRLLVRSALAHTLDRDDLLMVVARTLFEISPAVRQHLSDCLLLDLKEEIARIDPEHADHAIRLIETIEDEWRNERG